MSWWPRGCDAPAPHRRTPKQRCALLSLLRERITVLGANWLLYGLQFATGVMVARVLGPEGKGILLVLAGVAAALSSLLSFGAPSAAAFLVRKDRQRTVEIVVTCGAMALAGAVAAAALFALVSNAFLALFLGTAERIAARPLWIWLVVIGLLPALIAPVADALILVARDLTLYLVRNAGTGLLGVGLTWLFVLALGWDVTGVLIAQLLAALFPVGILLHWLAATDTPRRPRVTAGTVVDILRIGGQQYALSLVAMVAKRIDTFLVASILGVAQAGYLSVAQSMVAMLVDVPRAALWPLVGRLGDAGVGDRRTALTSVTRAQLGMILPLALAGAAVAPMFITIVYGQRFAPAVSAALAMMPAAVVAPLIVSTNAYFISIGRPGLAMLPAATATAVHVAVSVIGMPRLGVVANAIGFSVNQIVVAAMSLLTVRRLAGIRIRDMIVPSGEDWRPLLDTGRRLISRSRAGWAKAWHPQGTDDELP